MGGDFFTKTNTLEFGGKNIVERVFHIRLGGVEEIASLD